MNSYRIFGLTEVRAEIMYENNRCDLDWISSSVIKLLTINLNNSVYGQDASTDKTFLHSKTPKPFLL